MSPVAIAIIAVSTVMHASWNLLARDRSDTDLFLRALFLSAAVGIWPALLAEAIGPRFLIGPAGLYLLAAGVFQGVYFLGLTLGYRTGQFTVVYPLARALPVLAIALSDIFKGAAPAPLGWLGILVVTAGCLALPLDTSGGFRPSQYWNRGLLWAVVAAVGTIGYTIVDSAAAEIVPSGAATALRYGLYEVSLTFVAFWAILRLAGVTFGGAGHSSWRRTAAVAILLFGAYALVLWVYQMSGHTSYVVALRQVSIVIGVAVGGLFFHEPARRWRLGAAIAITLGAVCIALAR